MPRHTKNTFLLGHRGKFFKLRFQPTLQECQSLTFIRLFLLWAKHHSAPETLTILLFFKLHVITENLFRKHPFLSRKQRQPKTHWKSAHSRQAADPGRAHRCHSARSRRQCLTAAPLQSTAHGHTLPTKGTHTENIFLKVLKSCTP